MPVLAVVVVVMIVVLRMVVTVFTNHRLRETRVQGMPVRGRVGVRVDESTMPMHNPFHEPERSLPRDGPAAGQAGHRTPDALPFRDLRARALFPLIAPALRLQSRCDGPSQPSRFGA